MNRIQPMSGEKIGILREAGGGRSIAEVWKEKNITQVMVSRRKREFGMTEASAGKQ